MVFYIEKLSRTGLELTTRPDLRSRFIRSETALFKHRFETDDKSERTEYLKTLNFDWIAVSDDEKRALGAELRKCMWGKEDNFAGETWFKVSRVSE